MHVQYLSILFEAKININILTRIYDFLLENNTILQRLKTQLTVQVQRVSGFELQSDGVGRQYIYCMKIKEFGSREETGYASPAPPRSADVL